jgi:peptidyl-prolyl cis-trans isomerase SurA
MAQSQERIVIDKIVAKVGGETVLYSEVEEQYAYAAQKSGNEDEDFKCQILESIIGQKLIVNQAKLDSVQILDEEVEEQLNYRMETVLRQMNGDEQLFQEYYNMSVNDMKDNLRDQQKQQMLAERMQQSLISGVTVTPKEVIEFYNQIPSDSLPYLNSEVEIGEIVVAPEVNEEQREIARQKAAKIRQQIVDGEDFGELAKLHSDDPGSAAQEGNLGFSKRGQNVPEFEAAAYTLAKRELSDLVETEFGFHIIQMLERRGNNVKLRHILIRPDITTSDLDKAKSRLDSIRTLIVEEKLTFSNAVRLFSSDETASKNNSGRIKNPATGNTFFETKDLPTDIYFEIDNLEVGDISVPIEFQSPRGDTAFRLIQLQSRTKPHKASLEEDYSKILMFAKESKKQEYFVNWINEKLESTHIEVDPLYNSCPNVQDYIN